MRNLFKHVWAVLVISLLITSCSKSTDDLTNVIPGDAFYVIQVNTESLIKKSEWNVFENEMVAQQLKVVKVMMDENATKLFDAFMKDANALGINLKGHGYMFMGPSASGIVLSVNDAKKIKESLEGFKILRSESLIEKDNAYVYQLDGRNVLAWNKDKFLFISTEMSRQMAMMKGDRGGDNIDIETIALNQLNQDASASINKFSTFSKFLENCKDISIYSVYNPENYKMFTQQLGTVLPQEMIDELKFYEGMASSGYISFDKGAISMDSRTYFESSDAEKKFDELAASLMGSVKGEQIKYLSANPLIGLSASLKGEGIKSYLDRLGLWGFISKEMGDKVQILESVVNNIEGDMSFALSDVVNIEQEYEGWDGAMMTYDKQIPEVVFLADCKDGKAIIEILKDQLFEKDEEGKIDTLNSKFRMMNENVFLTDFEGSLIYLGIKDNMFFATNAQKVYDNIQSGTKKDNLMSQLSKDSYMTLAGDFQVLGDVLRNLGSNNMMMSQVLGFVDMFDTLEMVSKETKVNVAKINMKNTDKNSLAQICLYVDELIKQ